MMAASDVTVILGELWKIWLKTHDAGDDNQQTAQCLLASLEWWTQLIVENVAPLAAPGKKQDHFPYQKRTINAWFDREPEHSEVRRGRVNIINVNEEGRTKECYTLSVDKFPKPCHHHDYEIFYHGTTAKHARCIIEDGIDLSAGKTNKDFSDGDGFYVTDKFAEVWPDATWAPRRPPCSTVLIFKIKKDDLRRSDLRGLDLTENTNEVRERWKEVVSTFRNGKATRKFKQHLNADYIEGPLCGNVKNAECYTPTHVYQLCVRSERCVELFNRDLHSVIFFDK